MNDDTDARTFRPPANADGVPEWQSPPSAPARDPLAATAQAATLPWTEPGGTPAALAVPARSRVPLFAVVGLVAGAFLLTSIAGGAWLAYRMLLGHEDRVTAAYAPANVWAYGALNTDPTSQAWKSAWELAQRVGLDDELSALPEQGLEDSGEDPDAWDQYIRPAIGREVGFAVWPDPEADLAQGDRPHVAVIVMVSDAAKAREAIDLLLEDETPESRTYRDITYSVNDEGDAVGIVDEALIAAASPAAFEDIVDAHLDGALDEVDAFNQAADRAADDPLLFVYADSTAISDALEETQPMASRGLLAQTADPFDAWDDLDAITLTVKADGDALRIVTLSAGRPQDFPTAPAGDAFVTEMPAGTLFYVASSDLYTTVWVPLLAQLGGAEVDGFPVPDTGALEDDLGFDVIDGLLAHLTGDWALAAGAEEGGSLFGYSGAFRFYSEVDDADAVRATLAQVADAVEAQGTPVERTDNGFEVNQLGFTATVEVVDDVLRVDAELGSPDDDGSLADDEDYRRALDDMPGDAVVTGYVALHRLRDLLPAEALTGADADTLDALDALRSLAWASAADGDGTRTELVLFVEE